MQQISITGANSFIGRHLIHALSSRSNTRIKAMTSKLSNKTITDDGIMSSFNCNLLNKESLIGFVEGGCTVVNLAYLWDGSKDDNLAAMKNLLDQCEEVKIQRFIHVSTAVVVGRASDLRVTEKTLCEPANEYEETKLLLENMLKERSRNKFEYVIVRPTAVFGAGGKNLVKLINDLRYGSGLLNYIKSCVYNKRKMNLVCIANVVSTIEYLIDNTNLNNEIFIISDDESELNNYIDVQKMLIKKLGCDSYSLLAIPFPSFILSFILTIAGRTNINPSRIYDCSKLMNTGYKKPIKFIDGLNEFIESYIALEKIEAFSDH